MAIGYRLDKALGLTLVVWHGAVTASDAEDHVRGLFDDPEWPPGPRHLLDATSVTAVPIIANTKLVDLAVNAVEAKRVRFAVVQNMATDDASFFEREATERGLSQVIVFGGLANVCAWLGLNLAATQASVDDLRRSLVEDEPTI